MQATIAMKCPERYACAIKALNVCCVQYKANCFEINFNGNKSERLDNVKVEYGRQFSSFYYCIGEFADKTLIAR